MMFPGVVNLGIVLYTCVPPLFRDLAHDAFAASHFSPDHALLTGGLLFIYAWPAVSMPVACLAKVAEPRRFGRFLSPLLVYLGGFGPLLCAVTLASYVKEARKAGTAWEKTEKTGKVAVGA